MICLSIGIINHPKPEGTSDSLGWSCAKLYTGWKCVWVCECIFPWLAIYLLSSECECVWVFGTDPHSFVLVSSGLAQFLMLQCYLHHSVSSELLHQQLKPTFLCKGKMKFILLRDLINTVTAFYIAVKWCKLVDCPGKVQLWISASTWQHYILDIVDWPGEVLDRVRCSVMF